MKTDFCGSPIGSNPDVLIPIRFEFENPMARSVCVAGTFNRWEPMATPLIRGSGGHWGRFAALFAGIYEYCLVVDDRWILDPKNDDSVANPFGGRNSVLTLCSSTGGLELLHSEYLPAATEVSLQNASLGKTTAPKAPLLSPVIVDLPESKVFLTLGEPKQSNV